jgi:SAM-dependent methyltransferase
VDFAHPSLADRCAESVAFRLSGIVYRRYARTIALDGNERVLDFGCGGGALSRFLAPRLDRGGVLICYDLHSLWTDKARKRLRRRRNVIYVSRGMGRIDSVNGFDAIIVHFVLHDIPWQEREDTVLRLANLLAPFGLLYLREPTRLAHGIDPGDARRLMASAGLTERSAARSRGFLLGATFRAVYGKG